ncbi:MAG: hypothetical protein E7528_06735 [Ruminococcaceae bacterium]|nr:hypothetical protein [Oscillospiraceae bacterium]
MTQLKFNKQIANEIFNDTTFREELIMALNELIDIELAKQDDEIDFDLIDAYTDALNELYDEKGVSRVFWKLQTVEEFTNSITNNKKWKNLSFALKFTLTACAVMALVISANTVTEKVTGYNVIEQVASVVQEFFTGENEIKNSTTTTTSTETTTEENTTETTTKIFEESTTVKPQIQEGTTKTQLQITPQNPNLSQVLNPTTPPTETTTESTTAEAFTRVDEDVTAAPIVVKLTGEFAENFKKDYLVGETADFSGLTITAKYDNGDTKPVSINECNIYGFSTESPANRIVTVEYEGCSFSYLIRVKEAN